MFLFLIPLTLNILILLVVQRIIQNSIFDKAFFEQEELIRKTFTF